MVLRKNGLRLGMTVLSAGMAGLLFVFAFLLDKADMSASAYAYDDGLPPVPAESMELVASEYPLDRFHNAVENTGLGCSGIGEDGLCVEDDRIGIVRVDGSHVAAANGGTFSDSAEMRTRQRKFVQKRQQEIMRRLAEENRQRRNEREAALKAACPGYDEAFIAQLTKEERAEARAFYEEGFVFYRQNWSYFSDLEYGDEGFAQCGCGPTCAAMIISNLAGVTVDPEDMRKYALEHKCYLPNIGTTYDFLTSVPKKYGIKATDVREKETVLSALRAGKLVLVAMGPGDFTLGAHFMLYRGVTDDGKILIADSYNYEYSVRAWDWDTLEGQLKNGYRIYEKEEQ